MRHVRDESSSSKDQIIDLILAIRELNGLNSRELNKLLKESENFTIQCKTENGSLRQIDMEKLASSLPLHLIAVLLSPERDMHMGHVLCGVRLLHTLSDLAIRHARLEQILLEDVKLSEQILDLVFYTLIVLAHHNQVDICIDAAFAAVHEDIKILHSELSELNNEVLYNKSSLPAAERTAHYICQQTEASLQFLLSLCQQKMIRDRVLKHKGLCKNGGILLLAHMILKLNVPHCFKESFDIVATVSRLKAKILSILLQLCEAESISYLDEVAGSQKTMHLAKSVALEFLNLLKSASRREAKQLGDSHDKSSRKGLVLLNALCLADIFSDDSNFRSFFMANTIPVLAEILAIPHDEFLSSWCSVNIPIIEEDANLEYDPFTAAGVALLTLNNSCESARSALILLTETNYACPSSFSGMPSVAYAQQRTSYLVKIIANLHVFVPNICEGSLSDYARSLTPNLLNDEDVHLLSIFSDQLQTSVEPHIGNNLVQALLLKDEGTSDNKDGYLTQQSSLDWTQVSSPYINKCQNDTQNNGRTASSLTRKIDASAQEEAPIFNTNDVNAKGRTPEGSLQELDQLHVTSNQIENFETRGIESNSSKINLDLLSNDGELSKPAEHAKESGSQEDEKAESVQGEEKQPRKRKRNIMNEKQIFLIEKALLEEPEMQRNAVSLQSWADKLSCPGSEITSSQLKNWLNNRKARLARAAREARAPSEGETVYPDKSGGASISHFYDSPESAGEEFYVPPSKGSSHLSVPRSSGIMTRASSTEDNDMMIPPDFVNGVQQNHPSARSVSFESGQFVMLVDSEGKEVGKGKVFQVEGTWHGKNLDDSSLCIVDVTELKTDKWKEVQHPSEAAGRTFEEAAARNGGVMRVAWDVIRVVLLSR